jgi:hypothetical protein
VLHMTERHYEKNPATAKVCCLPEVWQKEKFIGVKTVILPSCFNCSEYHTKQK